jgi:XRE family aerobic/anaerobic benzoate catabolism transcriptional regulator
MEPLLSPEMARRSGLLGRLGARVRALREERGASRLDLARASGLSARYLAALEAGVGNISIARLADLARALATTASALLAEAEVEGAPGEARRSPQVISLLGLRGAGKSTVGMALARRLAVPFFELDERIEAAAGMPLGQVFELHGERWFRRLERETLARFLVETRRSVLATGGGLVTESETFDLLRQHTLTVWLKARPRDHWDRVVAQGDRRPMANRSRAMEELRALLAARDPLYARADLVVDTSALAVDRAVERIAGHTRRH